MVFAAGKVRLRDTLGEPAGSSLPVVRQPQWEQESSDKSKQLPRLFVLGTIPRAPFWLGAANLWGLV